MALEQRLDMVQRFGRPVDALQAQSQRVACVHVSGGEGHGPLQQAHRILEPAQLLQARGHDV